MTEKIQGKYVFPNAMARVMRNISPRTCMEAEMMSVVCILIGMIAMSILIIISEYTILFKALTIFNLLAGILFMSSRLATSFQQYQNYLAVMGIIDMEETK